MCIVEKNQAGLATSEIASLVLNSSGLMYEKCGQGANSEPVPMKRNQVPCLGFPKKKLKT